MRDRHVPIDLILTEVDVVQALDLIGSVMPVVCEALGFSPARGVVLKNLVRADYETYLRPVLLPSRTPKGATVQSLVDASHVGRSGVYEMLNGLIEDLESCALAIPLLLEARGDFAASTAWYATEVTSRVGKEARGPGIVTGRHYSYGLSMAGGDMCLPACLRAVEEGINGKKLSEGIRDILKRVKQITKKLGEYASSNEDRLDVLQLDASRVAELETPSILLVPQLHIGEVSTRAKYRSPVRPDAVALGEMVESLGISRLVVESSDDPQEDPQEWDRITPKQLAQMLLFAGQMGLDTAVRASEITYTRRRDGLVLHRHHHLDSPSPRVTGIANSMSFAVTGFKINTDLRECAEAIGYIEFLATNPNPLRCTQRFGDYHAPTLIKAANARPLLCAARMISNALLVSATRNRQALEHSA